MSVFAISSTSSGISTCGISLTESFTTHPLAAGAYIILELGENISIEVAGSIACTCVCGRSKHAGNRDQEWVYVFSVELAINDADRQKGLMFRKELPEGQGMLFDFKQDQDVSTWMRNTYISLEMLFINADGRIRRIAENTAPLSERIIPSDLCVVCLR